MSVADVKRKSKPAVNEGILNPETGVIMISCEAKDLIIEREGPGRITLLIDNFSGGIEIIHSSDRLWWPV